MSCYTLTRTQRLPIDIRTAWDFFSSPHNLQAITPAYMNFRILNEVGPMYAGQIITYKVSPIASIPLFWMTEITHVREGEYFVDEQRKGPYAMWHHQHFFKPIPGGIEMTDIVNYEIPLGILGDIAHLLFVKKQVEGIFEYRVKALEDRFGRYQG